jgi:hypothetical protein
MRNRRLAIGGALMLAAGAAHADGLAMKPGLWERTVTMHRPGMPAMPPELAQLPPEQRAQMEQMMGMMSGKPVTTRECVTPEMLKKWEEYSKGHTEGDCTHTVRESTPQQVSMAVSCDGGRTTGTLEYKAPTPERMTGSIDMLSRSDEGEHAMRMEIVSRWLGADCGGVAPAEP